jgi:LuxR family maltose regulon positive regulatory protein
VNAVRILSRERINKLLAGILEYPLFIVAAPMGYGKTTAVREFLKHKRINPIWVSLIASDGSTVYFWDRLTTQIAQYNKQLGEQLKSLGFPTDAPQTAKILEIIVSIEYKKDTVLVIDDFHLAASPGNFNLISYIVREEIPNLHIVLIMRDMTNIRFAELTSQCFSMTHHSLKFENDEIKRYFELMKYPSSPKEMAKVAQYTGGWVSMIYLIIIGLKKGIPVGISSTIDELVERNLYEPYDKLIRQFLLKLAVMESFTAEQAEFVLKQPGAEAILKKLYKENAFIDYDEATGIYKIHNVLLDFLRRKQNFEDSGIIELFKRIGEWHLSKGQYTAAYGFLNRAKESEYILKLLNDAGKITVEFEEFDGIREMFECIPKETLIRYPIAYIHYIFQELISGEQERALKGIQRLNELEQIYLEMEDICPNYKNRILGEINILRIFTVFNDAGGMIEYTIRAKELLKDEKSWVIRRESEFTFGTPHFLYSYYKEAGKLDETIKIMTEGFPAFSELSDGCGTGCEYLTLAEYALETGDFAGAELNGFKAVYKAKTKDQISIGICACFTLIRLYILQGKVQEGLEMLEQLKIEVGSINSSVYNTTMDLCEGYIFGCLGQLKKIPEWLQTGDMDDANFLYQGMAFNYIVYGKAVLLANNFIELEMLTESFLPYFSIFNNQLGFIHNYIHEAAAKYRLYGMEQGKSALRAALAIGQADGIVMPFAENAPYIFDLLRSFSNEDSCNEYLKRVILICEQYMKSLKRFGQSCPALSEREREVLKLLSEGLTRDEIAAGLYISTGTVKTHLQNIYHKLEVKGKIAAIKKAEKLKLF